MLFISAFLCRFSLGVISGLLVFLALTFIVVWNGGKIEKIKIPGLFDVTLDPPITFPGNRYVALLAGFCFFVAAVAGSFQYFNPCTTCEGLPGQTAWIYAGNVDLNTGKFTEAPVLESIPAGTKILDIEARTWIKLLAPRRTMILDYDTTGHSRALDSPFSKGKVAYTCKLLSAGQELYVAEKRVNGPDPRDNHVWFRVRFTRVGE